MDPQRRPKRRPTMEECYTIQQAVKNNDITMLKEMITHGVDVNSASVKDKYGVSTTPLHLAVEQCNNGIVHIVNLLLEEGADINAKNWLGRTPLSYAVGSGSEDMVKFLVEKGANVNVVDQLGRTPLSYAVGSGSEDMVKFLVEKGANVNVVNKGGRTPLYWAVEIGSEDLVKFLVEKGANVNVVDRGGNTLLHWAVESGSEGMVKFLVDKGANVNVVDHCGDTPLHCAVVRGSEDMVKFLVEKGANVNVGEHDGDTPLSYAVGSGSEDMVKFLVEKGANVNGVNEGGQTPLHWAVERDREDIVKFLVEKGANVNVVNKDGKTPFELAVEKGLSGVVSYFFKERRMDTSQFDEKTKKKISSMLDETASKKAKGSHKSPANTDHLSVDEVTEGYMDGELLGPDVRVALLGAEGSGKTCLSHTLVGKDYQDTPPTEGADHMEIVVESTTDWRPLTDEEKLDDLEQQKCLEAMFVSARKQQQRSILAPANSVTSPFVPWFDKLPSVPAMPGNFPVAGPMSTQPLYSMSHYRPDSILPHGVVQPIPPYNMQCNAVPSTQATILNPHSANFQPQFQSNFQSSPPINSTPIPFELLNQQLPSLQLNSFTHCYNQVTPMLPSANVTASITGSTSASTINHSISNLYQDTSTVAQTTNHHSSSINSSNRLNQSNEPFFSVTKFKNLRAVREQYNPKKKYINIWDFAGQAVFQHTHGVFVSDEVVCLIVFDASLSLDEVPDRRYPHDHTPRRTVLETICYWMELISSRVSKPSTSDKDHSVRLPTFILVGTHIDKLHSDIAIAKAIAFTKFVPIFQKEFLGKPFSLHIAGSKKGNLSFKKGSPSLFFVCNKQRVPTVINRLKRVVMQSASITRQTRPTRYVEVERKLMLLSTQEQIYVIGVGELTEVASSCGLSIDQEQLLKMTNYLHHKGALLHYHNVPSLSDTIILSPHWMAKLLTYVLTSLTCWPTDAQLTLYAIKRQKEGFLEEELINWSVKQFNESEAPKNRIATNLRGVPVVELFIKFLLIVDITQSSIAGKKFRSEGKKLFLVPHLLPYEDLPPSKEASFKFLFYFPGHFIPDNLVDQLIVKCAQWNNDRHYDLLRLSYQWVCLNLGQYQVYEVKPVDQHHYIELTIIPDPAMPPGYAVESYKESRELITTVKGFIDELMKEHMTAIVEVAPVECFIACPVDTCNQLHISWCDQNLIRNGRVYCTKKGGYCDLSIYLTILSSGPTQPTRGIPIQRPPTPNQRPTMRLIKKYIIPKIAARWKDVADFLEYDISTIDRIQAKHQNDCDECLDRLFRDWLSTNHGVGPKTWTTLLERLKEIETLSVATSDIEKELGKLGIL